MGSPLTRLRVQVLEAWALWVALETGLFERLVDPKLPDELCVEMGFDASALRPLLAALRTAGHLVAYERDRYVLAEESRDYLLADSPHFIGRSFGFLRTSPLFEQYPRLLREGGGLALTADEWGHVTQGSSAYVAPAIETMLSQIPELSRPGVTVLDVGCGRGDYVLGLAAKNPSLTAVAIDPTPSVAADSAKRLVSCERAVVRCCAIDDVDEMFDVVLLNHVVHVVGEDAGRQLLDSCTQRLRPGGVLVVQELVETDANAGAMFGFMMRLLFERGEVFTLTRLIELVASAGLVASPPAPIGPEDAGLVIVGARRPE